MLAMSGPVLNRKGKSEMKHKRLLCIPQAKSPSPKQQEKPCHVQCAEGYPLSVMITKSMTTFK